MLLLFSNFDDNSSNKLKGNYLKVCVFFSVSFLSNDGYMRNVKNVDKVFNAI